MENRTKEVFFPKSLEIGYLLTQEAKDKLEKLQALTEQTQELLGINITPDLISREDSWGNIIFNRTVNLNQLLMKLLEIEDYNGVIEPNDLKQLLDDDKIADLIEEGYLEVDTTDSLFKFLYEAFGNYNQISTRSNSKNERVNMAVLMYEFLNNYVEDSNFKQNLMDCYNESNRESVDHLDIEMALDMIKEYQSKVDELGL